VSEATNHADQHAPEPSPLDRAALFWKGYDEAENSTESAIHDAEDVEAMELLISRLTKTKSNGDFLGSMSAPT
jgi:hypothetical protein